MYLTLFLFAFFAVLFATISKKMDSTLISGPMLFITVGLILGPSGVNFLKVSESDEMLKILAEYTLALLLFSDATLVKTDVLKKNINIPKRLLLGGLPLTILLGIGAALLLFPEFSVIEAALLAIILAPTDAALGKAVVSNPKVPARIRESLNFESGMNDGICVPLLLVCIALISTEHTGEVSLLVFLVKAIGIGAAVGLGITYLTIKIIKHTGPKNWISSSWQKMIVIVMAIAIFSLSEAFHGSGFVGCFIGGILFGILARKEKESFVIAAEGYGELLAMLTWTYFGAVSISTLFTDFNPLYLLYGVLSLTLIRMLPAMIVLKGTDLNTKEKMFIGWFGPRGLASIVFAVILMGQSLPHMKVILLTITCTILLSVLAHGVSANPLIPWLVKGNKE